MKHNKPIHLLGAFAALALLSIFFAPAFAATDVTVYGDSLMSGWADWSWDTTRNFANASPTKTGFRDL